MILNIPWVGVEPHPVENRLTMWSATQFPHFVQNALVHVLAWPAHRIRVVAPDVGGGFGVKASMYPEEILIPLAAVQLGQPVKWIEDRREHFMASIHSREQVHHIEIAASIAASASPIAWRKCTAMLSSQSR